MTSKKQFELGDIVYLIADPSRSGSIIKKLPNVRDKYRYEVYHSSQDIRQYFEDQISLVKQENIQPIENGYLTPKEFFARLNAFRLKNPISDSIYALHAARIQFIPFQFKPMLKLVRAEQPRILIADEVGVGKTIEAGLILRELESRQNISNVLIVCPKSLVTKWHEEMKRFDEDFHILDSSLLKHCLKETHRDGIWPTKFSKSIIHLELLRRDEYLNGIEGKRPIIGLRDLEPPPQFDLLIVDEAHHLRTPDTNTHSVARLLCSNAEAIIFLSATPIQTSSDNLFSLLNLLYPETFIDRRLFQEMIEPNTYLNAAVRHIRTKRPDLSWQEDAGLQLTEAIKTDWGLKGLIKDPRFVFWLKRFQQNNTLTDTERIQCLRDLEEIHPFASIINRTRRRDIGKFTIREPHTIMIHFDRKQQDFYDKLIDFRREYLSQYYDPVVIRLITDILERQAESCLYGLIPLLKDFVQSGSLYESSITDSNDFDNIELPQVIRQKAQEILDIAVELPEEDPKLKKLVEIVQNTINNDGPGKILIFSYFLHTLDYLKKHLDEYSIRVEVINGSVLDEEREYIRNRFRLEKTDPEAIDVLLSSEVGCEGLDYEFCDRLVNYDIPWNPMRIEQRIGRIDRFGQMSEKVLIYNFVTYGTIAERIFYRCFERLGIFADTLGDLEESLGTLTEELTQAAFNPSLTPEQLESKVSQLADNALRELEEQRRMEEEGKEIMSVDLLLQNEIQQIESENKFVTPEDLFSLIELYLEMRCANAKINVEGNMHSIVKIRLSKEDKGFLLEDIQKIKQNGKQYIEFKRWLDSSETSLSVTFNQEKALENRAIPFITPIHPLTKMATYYWTTDRTELVTSIEVQDTLYSSGTYQFAIYLWETVAERSELLLLPLVRDLRNNTVESTLSKQLFHLIKYGAQSSGSNHLTEEMIQQGLNTLEEIAHDYRIEELEKIRVRNNQLIEQRLSKLTSYYERRILSTQDDLSRIANEKIRRMKKSMLERLERELKRKTEQLELKKVADILSQRIAHGVLVIK
ncbi:hypothetical protein FTO68_04705 [Methanocalculus taiwanensis]|uniref:Helicase n=1 Tax=Methanocalculus taiwanensis TaxID=106207 RepID=A0ABD4TKM5_9EURY|nr:SNF2-related protein [Methanocalculus taiwanensis]MCQ1538289.1 hypothetical protein [Methanocalculus taiwanensis]